MIVITAVFVRRHFFKAVKVSLKKEALLLLYALPLLTFPRVMPPLRSPDAKEAFPALPPVQVTPVALIV